MVRASLGLSCLSTVSGLGCKSVTRHRRSSSYRLLLPWKRNAGLTAVRSSSHSINITMS